MGEHGGGRWLRAPCEGSTAGVPWAVVLVGLVRFGVFGGFLAACGSSSDSARGDKTLADRRSVAAEIDTGDRWYFCGGVDAVDRAAASYDRAIAGAPDWVPAAVFARRAELYVRTGELAAGLALVDDVALKRFPDDVPILEQKIALLRALGRSHEAARVASRLKTIAVPKDESPRRERSRARDRFKVEKAVEQEVGVALKRGMAYLQAGDHDSAEREFRTAREMNERARAERESAADHDVDGERSREVVADVDVRAVARCREAMGRRAR